jgi:hypothetical protein
VSGRWHEQTQTSVPGRSTRERGTYKRDRQHATGATDGCARQQTTAATNQSQAAAKVGKALKEQANRRAQHWRHTKCRPTRRSTRESKHRSAGSAIFSNLRTEWMSELMASYAEDCRFESLTSSLHGSGSQQNKTGEPAGPQSVRKSQVSQQRRSVGNASITRRTTNAHDRCSDEGCEQRTARARQRASP